MRIKKLNEIGEIVTDLIKEANTNRPLFLEKPKTNEFYSKVNELLDVKSKIKLLRDVLKGIEKYFITKWKESNPRSGYANGYPIKFWKKQIKEKSSIYKKIMGMILELRKEPAKVFLHRFYTYEGAREDLKKYEKEFNKQKREEIENVFGFEFEKIKERGDKLKNLKDRLYHYEYVKKEYIQNKKYTLDLDDPNDSPFIEKLEAEIEYLKKEIENNNEKKSISITQDKIHIEDIKPIQWLGSSQQLTELFKLLSNVKFAFMPQYKIIEILIHFVDEKGKSFIKKKNTKFEYLHWKKSDGDFWQLVNGLVDNNLVPKYRKYQVFTKHFKNQNLEKFKYPAQSHREKKVYSEPNEKIIEILAKITSY